jgi:PEP-CTERM motif
MRFRRSHVLVSLALTGYTFATSTPPARGDVVYQSSFNALSTGLTLPYPGDPGQDGWFSLLAVGDAFGEVQSAIAVSGNALHEHTAATVPANLQTIDDRPLGAIPLAAVGVISLRVDFFASTSNLQSVNSFSANLGARGGPHPGFDIIDFGLGAGNGTSKSETGVNVALAAFNGTNNNDPIGLGVGQHLAWDTWHSISISLDQRADTWLSITVDGATQSLLGYRPPRSLVNGTDWLRGQQLADLLAQVVPSDVGGDRTNDDVYWDNISLTVQPVPEPSTMALIALSLAWLAGFARGIRRGREVMGNPCSVQ